MATKGNTPKHDKVVEFGNIKMTYETSIEVGGYTIPIIYWYPYLEISVEDYLTAKSQQLKDKAITEEQFTFYVQKMLAQGRYIPKALPPQLVAGKMVLQNRQWDVPLYEVASELYMAIKKLNPFDRSRQGNSNNVIFADGQEASIGSFTQLVMGISGTRESPKGGNSGGFSPCRAFEGLVPYGYNVRVISTSDQYSKLFKMLEARDAQAKAQQEAKANKPVKAQKKK